MRFISSDVYWEGNIFVVTLVITLWPPGMYPGEKVVLEVFYLPGQLPRDGLF